MEFVPFHFCQSVAHLLSPPLRIRRTFLSSSAIWQHAVEATSNIALVSYNIGYKAGVWSYFIRVKTEAPLRYECITLEKLQKLNRRHLRNSKIVITSIIHTHQASFEDITGLVKFALPCVNMAELNVCNTMDFPQDNLLELISLLRDSSIKELCARYTSAEMWAVLGVHLKSDSLKKLEIRGEEYSTEMRSAVTEFVMNSRFENFRSSCPAFLDMDLFKSLFNKPQTEPRWTLESCSSIELEELRDFEKHLQVPSEFNEIIWKRHDGLAIQATDGGCARSIRFYNI